LLYFIEGGVEADGTHDNDELSSGNSTVTILVKKSEGSA
jgi:hypothetical protein